MQTSLNIKGKIIFFYKKNLFFHSFASNGGSYDIVYCHDTEKIIPIQPQYLNISKNKNAKLLLKQCAKNDSPMRLCLIYKS
jgi:hypothetical protein